MKNKISFTAVGHATSVVLVVSYTLCVIFDLLFPNYAMYRSWQVLLPGFEWLSWKSYFLGLIEAYIYGWYFALVWVPVYNYFIDRNKQACCHDDKHHLPAH